MEKVSQVQHNPIHHARYMDSFQNAKLMGDGLFQLNMESESSI